MFKTCYHILDAFLKIHSASVKVQNHIWHNKSGLAQVQVKSTSGRRQVDDKSMYVKLMSARWQVHVTVKYKSGTKVCLKFLYTTKYITFFGWVSLLFVENDATIMPTLC